MYSDIVTTEKDRAKNVSDCLSNEIRIQILKSLSQNQPLQFNKLREETNIDNSGKFNYHLNKLLDTLVEKHNSEYYLTEYGWTAVGCLLAINDNEQFADVRQEAGFTCGNCDGSVNICLSGNHVDVYCTNCNFPYIDEAIPRDILRGEQLTDVPYICFQWLHARTTYAKRGFCYNCNGEVTHSVVLFDAADAPNWYHDTDVGISVQFDCNLCGKSWDTGIEMMLICIPEVISFHRSHGIEIGNDPWWLSEWVQEDNVSIITKEPLQLEILISIEQEQLRLVLDENLDVISSGREPA